MTQSRWMEWTHNCVVRHRKNRWGVRWVLIFINLTADWLSWRHKPSISLKAKLPSDSIRGNKMENSALSEPQKNVKMTPCSPELETSMQQWHHLVVLLLHLHFLQKKNNHPVVAKKKKKNSTKQYILLQVNVTKTEVDADQRKLEIWTY